MDQEFEQPNQEVIHYDLFTDPAFINYFDGVGEPYFTGSGDMDDVFCDIRMSMLKGSMLTIYICDDPTGTRCQKFKTYLGDILSQHYHCTVRCESEYEGSLPGTIVHIHAPISEHTHAALAASDANVVKYVTQGDAAGNANFLRPASPGLFAFLDGIRQAAPHRIRMYSTAETSFTIPRDAAFAEELRSDLAKNIYENAFEFNVRKKFGLPLDNGGITTSLFRNNRWPERPNPAGNGIASFKPLFASLRESQLMPATSEGVRAQIPDLAAALDETLDPTVAALDGIGENILDLLWVANKFCDYSGLVQQNQGRIPNMASLKTLVLKEDCPQAIKDFFATSQNTSTPLFDLTVPALEYDGIRPGDVASLVEYAKQTLRDFDKKLRMVSGLKNKRVSVIDAPVGAEVKTRRFVKAKRGGRRRTRRSSRRSRHTRKRSFRTRRR